MRKPKKLDAEALARAIEEKAQQDTWVRLLHNVSLEKPVKRWSWLQERTKAKVARSAA
jgi:hypothetical protein